jgi:hypothetical protein
MISLIEYLGTEPVSVDEVKQHCRIDDGDEDQYIATVIIPGARAMAEARSGAVIREGRYSETIVLGGVLSVGRVISIEDVVVNGVAVDFESTEKGGNEGKLATVTFLAGVDLTAFPGVKSWLLLTCGWMYANREMFSSGAGGVIEMPRSYVDSLLAPIEVPAPF